ncbi:hypothetical protein JQ594_04325 [Bradyrhizobium manausense]|uniref:hypothetical protein n=1 Tax=Bradyrhizobium manausense TaxID=989370 RepID=UPI001BA8EB2F|nr:hypothetical protein [Bradyrhizobium manausense]MBR0685129.1 hypothetical protein [Bradyrhizobium manausense]
MPHYPAEFEIPDEWLAEATFVGFKPRDRAYRSTSGATLVPLTRIEPVVRFLGYPKDFRGFDRARLVRILSGFVNDDEIEPVEAIELPGREFCDAPYRYRVCNGFHRFYGSIAAGFELLPLAL